MRRTRNIALALTALAFMAWAAHPAAAAALSGATGLLQIPTADVLPDGQWRLAAGAAPDGLMPAVAYGPYPGFEIGVTAAGDNGLRLAAKYALVSESASSPGLAIGMDGKTVYAVASRRVGSPGVRAHVGVAAGDEASLIAGVEARLRSVVVASADTPFGPPAVSLMADYDGRRAAAGARFDFAGGLELWAGYRQGDGVIASVSYQTGF
ncbi:MAG: hypothetical protein H0Z37_08305 [Firmicutes bacterium]|nr:hypothetical protein [Bacillota bacterium]